MMRELAENPVLVMIKLTNSRLRSTLYQCTPSSVTVCSSDQAISGSGAFPSHSYISASKDGYITIDIDSALKNKVPESLLKAAGISVLQIEKAKKKFKKIK